MTGYQKLKQENERLKKEKMKLIREKCILYRAVMKIIDLKGPEVTKAPGMAWDALKEYAEENDN